MVDLMATCFCFSSLLFFLWDICLNKGNRSEEFETRERPGKPKFSHLNKKVCISLRFTDLKYLNGTIDSTFKDGTTVKNAS